MMIDRFLDSLIRAASFKKPKPDDGGPRYGDLNERALAAAIDILILYTFLFRPFLWIQNAVFSHVDENKLDEARGALAAANDSNAAMQSVHLFFQSYQPQLWVLNALLQIFFIGVFIVGAQLIYGNTPGKYLFGLKIVDDKTLEAPKRWQYVLRYLAYVPSAMPLMLGIFWTSFNKKHRGWHDYIAGTAVLNTRPRGWYWQQTKKGFRWLKARIKGPDKP